MMELLFKDTNFLNSQLRSVIKKESLYPVIEKALPTDRQHYECTIKHKSTQFTLNIRFQNVDI